MPADVDESWPGARIFLATADGQESDEIALNPRDIRTRPLINVLSTVVHEMVHLAQHHFGKPSRNGYHNRQWATAMKAIGLQPSDTGEPGGRETGQQVSHYVVPGGPFDLACQELLADGFTLPWGDVDNRRPATERLLAPSARAQSRRVQM